MKLYLKPLDSFSSLNYKENKNNLSRYDSGYDLFSSIDIIVEPWKVSKVPLGVACAPDNENYYGYYLYPRSSISKTPLMLANSVGIIDAGYRGEICAMVRNCSNDLYTIKQGDRLFQLCSPDLKPLDIIIVNELSESERGTNGFGSTGTGCNSIN